MVKVLKLHSPKYLLGPAAVCCQGLTWTQCYPRCAQPSAAAVWSRARLCGWRWGNVTCTRLCCHRHTYSLLVPQGAASCGGGRMLLGHLEQAADPSKHGS